MAQLTFNALQGGGYEAITTANNDFNLHIERSESSLLTVSISTVENGVYVDKLSITGPANIDEDFNALVYPKYIRIFSLTQPTNGYITEATSSNT